MTRVLLTILLTVFLAPSEGSAFLQIPSRKHRQAKEKETPPPVSQEPCIVEPQNEVCEKGVIEMAPEVPCCIEPEKKWYFEVKPAYYYLTDNTMRAFFDQGGFTGRVELGYKVWKPLYVWLDGGYFQKSGHAIGGSEKINMKLATITLGLKGIYFVHDRIALYAGVGPRIFMLMMHNDSPYVRGDDNAIGIGGGFDGGFKFFPFPKWDNIFFDVFVDYSLKNLKIAEDEISSTDSDIDVSGVSAGIGLGIRF